MDDLVQRLRGGVYGINRIELCVEAADEIERLRKMNSDLTDKANHYMICNARIEEWAEIQIGKNK